MLRFWLAVSFYHISISTFKLLRIEEEFLCLIGNSENGMNFTRSKEEETEIDIDIRVLF